MTDRTLALGIFCRTIGIEATRFKNLRQQHRLPLAFFFEHEEREEDAYRGWTRYSPADALKVRCAMELSDNNGLGFSDASAIVSNCAGGIGEFLEAGARSLEFWIGAIEYRSIHGDGGEKWRGRGHHWGSMAEIFLQAQKSRDDLPARMILCSLPQAWSVLSRRARTMGYDMTPAGFAKR